MKELLSVSGLCKAYRNFALKDVSFCLEAGTVTGLVGPNGAGKTTTIRSLLALSPYSGGQISFFGGAGSGADPAVRARLGVVLDGSFFADLTAEQMKRIIAPAYPAWSDADFRHYLEMFSLDPRRKIKAYSRGMRAQLSLALALSHQAELLIMDEPTDGLDPMIRRDLLDVLREYMRGGERGVLFSTHITSDLDRIADDIILMDAGRVVFQKNRDDLTDGHRLVRGGLSHLTPEITRLVRGLKTTPFGFSGLTAAPEEVRAVDPNLVLERPAIEDIMAAYVGEEAEEAYARTAV